MKKNQKLMLVNRVFSFSLLMLLISNSGCATLSPTPSASKLSTIPSECRDHVHVIFVDSPVDVGKWGGLPKIAKYLRCAGIRHSVYRDAYVHGIHGENLAEDIRRIKCQDPCAKIMLVGWSFGSMISTEALRDLSEQGICVDTMVYLDSYLLNFTGGHDHPKNVKRTVLVYREHVGHPDGFDCAVVHKIERCRHLNVPMDEKCVCVLFNEAIRLARCTCNQNKFPEVN